MKKALLLGILAIGAISFSSCTKEDPGKDSVQIAKEALEKTKESPSLDTLSIAKIDSLWLDDIIPLGTSKPTFKQIVAAISGHRPLFFGNYQVLRYLSDEQGYDGSKDGFTIEDKSDNEYLRFTNLAPGKEEKDLEEGTCSSTYRTWHHDNGGKFYGVLYERKGDYLVIFYDFDPAKQQLIANYNTTQLVNKDLNRAKRDEFSKVVFPASGSNIEFVKLEDKVEKAICDRWDGSAFKYSAIPYTKQ